MLSTVYSETSEQRTHWGARLLSVVERSSLSRRLAGQPRPSILRLLIAWCANALIYIAMSMVITLVSSKQVVNHTLDELW